MVLYNDCWCHPSVHPKQLHSLLERAVVHRQWHTKPLAGHHSKASARQWIKPWINHWKERNKSSRHLTYCCYHDPLILPVTSVQVWKQHLQCLAAVETICCWSIKSCIWLRRSPSMFRAHSDWCLQRHRGSQVDDCGLFKWFIMVHHQPLVDGDSTLVSIFK